MKEAKSLFPKAGETVLLYENGKVILKKDYTSDSVICTRFDFFIGTNEAVKAKIIELGLKDILEPKIELPNPDKIKLNKDLMLGDKGQIKQ